MKRWTVAVFILVACSLTFPVMASYAPDEIATNPNTPPPFENLMDWLGGLWQAMMDALAQDPSGSKI